MSGWVRRAEHYIEGPGYPGVPQLVPWQVVAIFLVSGVVLIPWTVFLFLTLPKDSIAAHWRLAWAGYDVMLLLTLIGTGIRILRKSPKGIIVSTVAGTLLIADVWFDVMLSPTVADRLVAGAMALFVELPIAALCLNVAFSGIKRVEEARVYLRQAGFRVTAHHVVPPDDWPR
jgi:hypothetical protein